MHLDGGGSLAFIQLHTIKYSYSNLNGHEILRKFDLDITNIVTVQNYDFPNRFKAKECSIFYELWDGALCEVNNPILARIIKAYRLQLFLNDIEIISLGTNNSLMPSNTKRKFWDWKQIALQFRRNKFAVSY